jgi:hypothetical protein
MAPASSTRPPRLERADIGGEPHLRITDVDRMPPFFMNIVGAGDMWLFAGSNGPFTAGRSEPDHAAFPYQTVDKILDNPRSSGSLTLMRVETPSGERLWEPWAAGRAPEGVRRSLAKHLTGCSVAFEEAHEALGLEFTWELATGARFGLVRRCRLRNRGASTVRLRLLDGWNRVIAPGVTQELWSRYSYLAAGYMRHEALPCGPGALQAVYTLNAALADKPEPAESLRCTGAWALGHGAAALLLSGRQVEAFRLGGRPVAEAEVRGEVGAFLACEALTLEPGAERTWLHGIDTQMDPAAVVGLRGLLRDPERVAAEVEADLAASRLRLRTLVGGADGLQCTADDALDAHHFANALFNSMRGGVFEPGAAIPADDLRAFVRSRSKRTAQRHAAALEALPQELLAADVEALAEGCDDPQLRRLLSEYLPLTMARRHGDPSRPWNQFRIRVRDEQGRPVYGYEGNWRDIFQNWEALGCAYPQALERMVAVFLNASTADGYNPYRVTRDGVDWEAPSPGDPWGHLGYWGDHQIVYLLRLLQALDAASPGWAAGDNLRRPRFASADVPYELVGFEEMLRDPRHTIRFNQERHRELLRRAAEEGGDGKLLRGSDGEVRLASPAEKLLAPLLAKLSSLVPGGGVWLNTQRPEWNDANNALAGWGLSVVTTCYLRAYLVFLRGLLAEAGAEPLPVSASMARWVRELADALQAPCCSTCGSDADRLAAMRALGQAGQRFRDALATSGPGADEPLPVAEALRLADAALAVVEATIRANLRPDGLIHSYNILKLTAEGAAVGNLAPMLEGQVAALSSGLVSSEEALRILDGLEGAGLFRPDQRSYILYPDRELDRYLDRGLLPADAAEKAPLLVRAEQGVLPELAVRDADGVLRFSADLRNAADLEGVLAELQKRPGLAADVERDGAAILAFWEEAFHHSEFTGRSGTFFMFEGLGSIYWHMVAKLLLAVQECAHRAADAGEPAEVVSALAERYHRIRDGLGFRKSPAEYGAFPTDPYSHTPAHLGAQQPGMTGQVKEELLTRRGELGLRLRGGRLAFKPKLLRRDEFLREPARFDYVTVTGGEAAFDLPAGSLGFTCCGTLVVYTVAREGAVALVRADGGVERVPGTDLDACRTSDILRRNGAVARIEVRVPEADLSG